jgi:hypothetical protein
MVALCHIYDSHTLRVKSSHTHALHELSCLFEIFYVQEKYLCCLKSQLSFISLFSFEMLYDCVISGLYMRVLKLT